jgi:hypothetical protein
MVEKVKALMDARDEDKILVITLQKQIRSYETQVKKLRVEVDQLRKEVEKR